MRKMTLLFATTALLLGVCSCAPKNGNSDKNLENTATEMKMESLEVTLISDNTVDGVRTIKVTPSNLVCSNEISFSVKDGVILDVAFVGGCPGNTLGIASLIKGMTVKDAIERLDGINCASKPTSCPDQLARAMKLTLEKY